MNVRGPGGDLVHHRAVGVVDGHRLGLAERHRLRVGHRHVLVDDVERGDRRRDAEEDQHVDGCAGPSARRSCACAPRVLRGRVTRAVLAVVIRLELLFHQVVVVAVGQQVRLAAVGRPRASFTGGMWSVGALRRRPGPAGPGRPGGRDRRGHAGAGPPGPPACHPAAGHADGRGGPPPGPGMPTALPPADRRVAAGPPGRSAAGAARAARTAGGVGPGRAAAAGAGVLGPACGTGRVGALGAGRGACGGVPAPGVFAGPPGVAAGGVVRLCRCALLFARGGPLAAACLPAGVRVAAGRPARLAVPWLVVTVVVHERASQIARTAVGVRWSCVGAGRAPCPAWW